MSYGAIDSSYCSQPSIYVPTRKLECPVAKSGNTPPNTDVIDLSKPPTQEQAERMRNAGILGYGSVSVNKTVTTETLSNNVTVTHVTTDCQNSFFDVVNKATVRTSSTGVGVFTSGGSAFASTTTETVCSWDDGSWTQATLHESAFSFQMHGQPSWYIPPHLNEDGSWSLAEYGPSPKATISGYHSVLSAARSGGGKTQVSRFQTAASRVEVTIPSGERPAGAVDFINESFGKQTRKEMLARLGQIAAHFPRGFDTRA